MSTLPFPKSSLELVARLTSPPSNVDVLVIGAGPTGLGAAKRLHQIVTAFFPCSIDTGW